MSVCFRYTLILDAATSIADGNAKAIQLGGNQTIMVVEENGGFLKDLELYVSGPWYEILCIMLFVATATVYVHGSNLLFCIRAFCCRKFLDRSHRQQMSSDVVDEDDVTMDVLGTDPALDKTLPPELGQQHNIL